MLYQCIAELTFEDVNALQAGLGSEEGQAAVNDVPNFAPAASRSSSPRSLRSGRRHGLPAPRSKSVSDGAARAPRPRREARFPGAQRAWRDLLERDDVGLALGEGSGLRGQRLDPARDVPRDEAHLLRATHTAVRVAEARAAG